ncbi:helix-turn-helix domain-containing protein [Lachnospiraceae bacterium LCP25S3_G4]
MSFSEKLKILRDSKDITQKELANYLEVSRATVAGYETRNRQPDFDKLIRLAQYFQVSVDYLVGKDDLQSTDWQTAQKKLEKDIDQKIALLYSSLSLTSKQSALEYIELLRLKDKSQKIKLNRKK